MLIVFILQELVASNRLSKVSTPEIDKNDYRTQSDGNDESESVNDFLDSLSTASEQDLNGDGEIMENDDEPLSQEEEELKIELSKHQHWKYQEIPPKSDDDTVSLSGGGGGGSSSKESTTFSANRELWQRRASSQSHLGVPIAAAAGQKSFRVSQEFRDMRQKHTPDLVMDLPLSAQDLNKKSSSSSICLLSADNESNSHLHHTTAGNNGPESPDMSTAAERFAKQNQCTLKKNTKTMSNGTEMRIKSLGATTAVGGGGGAENDVELKDIVRSASSSEITGKDVALRSPLPPRSTPMIAAKFADMKLTGGSQQVSSFKPQVKVKPTILRKPVLPFTPHPHMSPELARKIEKQVQSTEQAK